MRTSRKDVERLVNDATKALDVKSEDKVWSYISKLERKLNKLLEDGFHNAVTITPHKDNAWTVSWFEGYYTKQLNCYSVELKPEDLALKPTKFFETHMATTAA